ncbi:MAG: beta strand repeat-containing protein [Allosphingosinicella sp.]
MSWDEIIKGTNGSDNLSGGSGDDFLQGKAGGDTLDGGSGDDMLHGDAGDDHLRGGSGNDFIHGGNGFDRAYYTGSILEYSFARDGENLFVNHTGGSQIDGNDRLLHVEQLIFGDAVIDLNQNNAPIAFNDTASTQEDVGTYSGSSVLANDFDWENNTLTAVAGTFNGVYGTLVLNANGTYTYTPNAAAQALALAQTVQDVFTYTVSDGSLSDTGTLTITIAGRNDAPVANPDVAATGENASVSINVLANDTDIDNGAVLTVTAASAPAGQGSASVVANQVVFNPGTDFDHLDTGESAVVVVSYTITDEHGAASSSTVTVTVNGAHDAPVANDDAASTTEDGIVAGNVLANDTDVDGETLTVTNPGVYVGAYGILTLAADGSYTYAPGAAAQGLDDGETVNDVFSYTASDGTASDTAALTVTVNGANDAPVANDDSASTNEDGSASGNVLANDTDVDGETLTVTNPGVYVGANGTLTLNADGSYIYVPGAAAQGLDDGETVQDVFAYTASDGTVSDSATLTVTVNGANDAPVANDDVASMDEDTAVSGNVLANDTDVDVEALTVTSPGVYVGSYGTLTLAADGSYTYTPNAAAQALDDGDVVQDVFNYTASDGTASDTATLTVTVNGANDGPQTVWYIDNSAVGSTNVGTQANPFMSIAAFNAAQGDVGGPQEGATVYLLQGTGTYAEADGINLLDDQILIGVGQPTIAPLAGNGVDLAEDNNVSGVDISVSAGNVGIEDDGGSVGNLVVSDVAVAGGGQIVDIDNGGSLNVTLNSAGSTLSSGGAIDLNAVGGSFTVTGATTISGATGGGVDVTSGVNLAVDFQGGLSASTGAATAVNFQGNMGSSALTVNGLDLLTTTGTGLNVTSGGTVTVTGAGNNIATTGGTAVSITFATIGAGGVTLDSVSSIGGTAAGIVLDTAGSGGFNVGGGTIANKVGAVGVSINATSDVALANMSITGNSNGGILGTNVNHFSLTSSTLTNNGSSASQGAVYFTGLTGTADLLGNVIGGSSGDNVHIVQTGGSLDLEIADNGATQAIMGTVNNATGNDSVFVSTTGSASLLLEVDGVDFQGARGDLLQVLAEDQSTQDVTISNNNFHNLQAGTGGGVTLNGGGAGSNIDVTYSVVDNSFTGANGTALAATYGHQAGAVDGNIEGNTIGIDDGVAGAQGSSNGSGIVVTLDKFAGAGSATYSVSIVDNNIADIDSFDSGIYLRANGDGTADSAILEASVSGNTISEMGDFTFAGLYALVGGSAFAGDFAELGLLLEDNVIDMSDADFAAAAVYLDQLSGDAHYYFPGYTGSPDGEFMGGTASVDLEQYFTDLGNTFVNVAFPSGPGAVDAQIILGATGDGFFLP